MANLEGGSDNITVQIVSIPGEPLQEGETLEMATTQTPEREPPERGDVPRWLWTAAGVLLAALGWLLFRGC